MTGPYFDFVISNLPSIDSFWYGRTAVVRNSGRYKYFGFSYSKGTLYCMRHYNATTEPCCESLFNGKQQGLANGLVLLFNIKTARTKTARAVFYCFNSFYSIILVTTPAPTVFPPSLIANLSPSSIATGVISFTSISALSPGIIMSPLKLNSPVTSVVLK